MKRFQITQLRHNEVLLTLAPGYGRGEDNDLPEEHEFWAPMDGGYVREITDDRPGTLGRQVCENLFGCGSTLHTSPDHMADAIRRRARRHCDAIDRERRSIFS